MLIVNKLTSSCYGKRQSRANELFAFTTQTLYNNFDKYG